MAVSIDVITTPAVQDSSFTQTWAHTCSGSNRLLVVFVRLNAGVAGITGVTYNGVSMTDSISLSPSISHKAFYMIAPPTGAHNIVVTITNSGWQISSTGISLNDVDQTTPINATASKSQTITTITNNITTTVSNTLILSACCANAVAADRWTSQTGSTEIADHGGRTASTKALTSATTTSTGFTYISSDGLLLLQLALTDIEQPVAYTQSLTDAISFTLSDKRNFGNILSNDFSFTEASIKHVDQIKSEFFTLAESLQEIFITAFTFDKLLLETGDSILQETGDYIMLEPQNYGQSLTELSTFNESLIAADTIENIIIDSFIFTEVLQKITGLSFSESLSFFESLLKAYDLTQTEQFTLAESLQKVFVHQRTESFTLTDSFQKEISSNFSELLNFTESSTTLSEFSKAITENPIISESLIKIFGLTKENSLSFLEVLSKNFFAQKTAEFSFIENISLTSEFTKSLIDTITLAEVFSKELNKPIVESLNLAILFSSSVVKRNLSEVFSFIEILSKETRKTFNEIFNIIESSSLLSGRQQSISELVDFSESFIKSPGKMLSNSVGILDSTQLINEFTRNLTESAVLVELIKVETGLNKAESVEFADNILNIITKKFTDATSLIDVIATITSFDKSLTDVFSFIETLKKEYSIKNDEILSLTDLIFLTFDAKIRLTETIDILDILIKQAGLSFSEALEFIELKIKDISINRSILLDLAENIFTSYGAVLSRDESIAISESFLKLFERSQTETIEISEEIKNTIGLQNIESIEFSDSFIKAAEKQNVESISITDTFNTDSVFKRIFSASLNISSFNTISSEKNILDLISITDSIYKSINIPKSEILIVAENDTTTTEKIKTENVTLDEALKKSYTINLVEEASLIDTLQKLFNAELSLAEILDLTMSLSFHETDVLARGRTVLLSKQGRTVLLSKQT